MAYKEKILLELDEVAKEANAILEYATEAQFHAGKGDLQAAADVLSLSHYKVSSYQHCKDATLKDLNSMGFEPGKKKEKK